MDLKEIEPSVKLGFNVQIGDGVATEVVSSGNG